MIPIPHRTDSHLLLAWLVAILEVLAVSLATVWLLISPPVFERYYPAITKSERAADAARIVRWLWSHDNVEALNRGLRDGQLKRKELKHYEDVRRWLQRLPVALIGVVAVGGLLSAATAQRIELLAAAQWRGLAFWGVLLAFALAFAFWDWKVLFAWLHYPLFGETSWRLSRSAYSLQLFPATFWQLIASVCLIAPILIIMTAGLFLRRQMKIR